MENLEISFEKLLKKWRDMRKSYSKIYDKDELLFSKFLKNNGNKGICNSIFNYSVEANRCVSCSEFCMLTENGEPSEEKIKIGGLILTTKHFPMYEEQMFFSNFSNKDQKDQVPEFTTFMLKTKKFRMLNFEKENGKFKHFTTHRILAMTVMEYYSIEVPMLAAYLCDKLTIVEKNQKEILQLEKTEFAAVLKSLLSITRKIIHGNESREYIKIFKDNKVVKVEISPCSETSIKLEKDKKNYFIPSESFDENFRGTFPVDIIIKERPENYNVEINFPIMERYKKFFVYGLRATEQLFEYYEKTCDNVFPEFRFYLWMIALMSDANFYENFSDEFLSVLFFEEDKQRIKLELPLMHSKTKVTYEDIKQFCFNTQFRMKLNCRELVIKFIET